MAHLLSHLARAAREPVDAEDPDSLDEDLIREIAPWVDRACRAWYRLEVRGLERVPDGPALLVGNHNAGITFVEAIGVGARWYRERGAEAHWHGLAHDAMVDMPLVGNLLVRIGAIRAGHRTAAAAFARGGKVVVFPGGNLEAFRPWSERDRIAFGGRTGFVKLALTHGVPIVPMVFHGGHSSFVVLRRGRRLARAIGAQRVLRTEAFPLWVGLPWGVALGPWFHLPLPVKCTTVFLDPIPTSRWAGMQDDPAVLAEVRDLVVSRMQEALTRLAEERRGGL